MVIDAMGPLYSGRFDGFCIASSDATLARVCEATGLPPRGGLTT